MPDFWQVLNSPSTRVMPRESIWSTSARSSTTADCLASSAFIMEARWASTVLATRSTLGCRRRTSPLQVGRKGRLTGGHGRIPPSGRSWSWCCPASRLPWAWWRISGRPRPRSESGSSGGRGGSQVEPGALVGHRHHQAAPLRVRPAAQADRGPGPVAVAVEDRVGQGLAHRQDDVEAAVLAQPPVLAGSLQALAEPVAWPGRWPWRSTAAAAPSPPCPAPGRAARTPPPAGRRRSPRCRGRGPPRRSSSGPSPAEIQPGPATGRGPGPGRAPCPAPAPRRSRRCRTGTGRRAPAPSSVPSRSASAKNPSGVPLIRTGRVSPCRRR